MYSEPDSTSVIFCLPIQISTRKAYGVALKKMGDASTRVVALDGDTKNSTFADIFKKAHPDRFIECFIAEQNMVCNWMQGGLGSLKSYIRKTLFKMLEGHKKVLKLFKLTDYLWEENAFPNIFDPMRRSNKTNMQFD